MSTYCSEGDKGSDIVGHSYDTRGNILEYTLDIGLTDRD